MLLLLVMSIKDAHPDVNLEWHHSFNLGYTVTELLVQQVFGLVVRLKG
jgi:hypothetical protein